MTQSEPDRLVTRLHLLPRPSSRAFYRQGRRLPGYSFFDWLHGYVYARWTYLYIGIGTGEHPWAPRVRRIIALAGRLSGLLRRPASNASPGAAGFADAYHGKVMTLPGATRLVTVERDIDLGDLEHVIPYATARDLVLQQPDHIVALECPCRAARPNPCLPLDVCLIVGEPFAGFVMEHHPARSRRITPREATDILRAEHDRGHVSHAFFKAAMLGRFYAICNCCSCCCGAMQAHQSGVPMLASSGYVCRADSELCQACGVCATVCQFDAITLPDGCSHVDEALCMGCGVCIDRCPEGALALVRDESKGIPLELDTLLAQRRG